jgi:methylase of polypeptide subunit release factors
MKVKKHEQPRLLFESRDSVLEAADKLVSAAKELMRIAKTEEDLRVGFEKVLEPLCRSIRIKLEPRYEKYAKFTKVFSDVMHGRVLIEYEKPGAFQSQKWIDHAYNQLFDQIQGEAKAEKETLFLFDPKFIGVAFDGEQLFFVRYRGEKNRAKTTLSKKDFILEGPHPFDQQSARTLLTYLRALSRKLLTAENLAQAFGPKSKVAPMAVSAFADALEHWGGERVRVFFNEWKRLFGIVYGERFGAHQAEDAQALSKQYKVGRATDLQELLFSVHTYFALLMKFIAAELITFKESSFAASYSHELTHSSKNELKARLADIEDGGVYAKRGITNFLEGDFFRWYLDAFSSPRLEDAVREMARGLSEFEPATTLIDPESTRDLLKKLYQYLVPQQVRHNLGEYYTPDWLAELVLDETGYKGDLKKRLLDPACGSGTFLVLAIKRAIGHGKEHGYSPLETVKSVVANIWGFDLNPLAVIAARTNYLFAMGDIISELPSFELPVYLADSVLWPERRGQILLKAGEAVEIPLSFHTFLVPKVWVENKGFLMARAAPLVEKMARERYDVSEAMERFKKEGLAFPPHEEAVQCFYADILKLEKEGKNGIWARFLKNSFAPMTAGKFDYVAGNPPWIRWDYLSQEYREATLSLWRDYGLFSLKGHAARLGGGKKDFSMLFTYASADHYLKDKGRLGFLITQEVFKSKGAGEGFRKFHLGESGKQLRVLKAHDFVTVQPFEGAANKTAAIFLEKGAFIKYPVDYTVWKRKKRVGKIPTDYMLKQAKSLLQKEKLSAQPIGSETGAWQTMSPDQYSLASIEGKNYYKARSGAYTSPYGVFWVNVEQVLSEGDLLISNNTEQGKRKIPIAKETIEADLVFPVIRGSDVKRWGAGSKIFALIVQDPKKRHGYDENLMKQEWPRIYGYLLRFKDFLITQAAYIKYHKEQGNPFYSQYNIAEYTFAPYKVIWNQMGNELHSSVISQINTPFGYKSLIPLHTTALIATSNESEAHYLCAIINSKSARDFIKSYSSAGRGFGTPSVMNYVGIPKFDRRNKIHSELARLSKKLHELKKEDKTDEIPAFEKEVDKQARRLFGIKE